MQESFECVIDDLIHTCYQLLIRVFSLGGGWGGTLSKAVQVIPPNQGLVSPFYPSTVLGPHGDNYASKISMPSAGARVSNGLLGP